MVVKLTCEIEGTDMSTWRETGDMTLGQMIDIPPVWFIGAVLLVLAQVWALPDLTVSFGPARVLGGALGGLGAALLLWTVMTFRRHQTSVVPHQMPTHIITTGPFARSRNPIYLADTMMLCGVVLWWGAWPSLVLIPAFVWILKRRFIAPEEQRMKQSFGPDFTAFKQNTPRWL